MESRTAVLAVLLLLLGSINTLVSKYQDTTVVGHTAKGEVVYFQHPAVQCGFMFFGEFLCLVPYFIWKLTLMRRKLQYGRVPYQSVIASQSEVDLLSNRLAEPGTWSPFHWLPSHETFRKLLAFFVPAVFDAAATILLYTGLMFTYASTFQMLRGTMVLWCGLLTICVLRRNLHVHHWIGICMIAAGSAIVVASSVVDEDPTQHPGGSRPRESGVAEFPMAGAGLVILGQLLSAVQFIVEETFLAKYRVPALLAVGLEGFWGLILCFVVLPVLSVVSATDGLPLDDVPQAFRDILAIPRLQVSFAINMVCIAIFNFLALVVTSELSAGWRAVIDTLRTLIIWSVSVAVFKWEYFYGLQVVGFAVLIAGMSLYNELMRGCLHHPGLESPMGSVHSAVIFPGRSQQGVANNSRPAIRVGSQEPLLSAEAGESPTHPTRNMNMPSSNRPRSPTGRPPLHPNSFGNNHIARSLTINPDVLSPHSMGSYTPSGSLRSPAPILASEAAPLVAPPLSEWPNEQGSALGRERAVPAPASGSGGSSPGGGRMVQRSSLTMIIGSSKEPQRQ